MKTLLLLAVLALFSLGSTEEGARLLASKSLLNRYAVEGRDLTLQYNIYNVGSRWGFGFDFWNELFLCVCVLETNEEANLKKLTPKYCFNMMYVGLLFCKNYKKNIINNQRFFLSLSAALEVELSDDSFPPEDFGIVSGMLNVKWDRIAPYPKPQMIVLLSYHVITQWFLMLLDVISGRFYNHSISAH